MRHNARITLAARNNDICATSGRNLRFPFAAAAVVVERELICIYADEQLFRATRESCASLISRETILIATSAPRASIKACLACVMYVCVYTRLLEAGSTRGIINGMR